MLASFRCVWCVVFCVLGLRWRWPLAAAGVWVGGLGFGFSSHVFLVFVAWCRFVVVVVGFTWGFTFCHPRPPSLSLEDVERNN